VPYDEANLRTHPGLAGQRWQYTSGGAVRSIHLLDTDHEMLLLHNSQAGIVSEGPIADELRRPTG
jgi:hypothetical protein